MRAIVLAVVALVAFANVGRAQGTAYRELGADITVRASQTTGILKYRVFGIEPEIGLRVLLSNRSDEVIRVASSVVSRHLKVTGMQSGVDVPLDVRWLTDGHLATDTSEVIWLNIQLGDSLSLPPHSTLVWDFDVARV